jgi:glycosyltransferase involved in cell wall biosynthesis
LPKLSIVIPVFNEAEIIPELYRRCISATEAWCDDFEIIVINDASTDNSLALLQELNKKDKRWKVISFSRNFGHQAAFHAGLANCTGDYVAMIDGDLQDPPELLQQFYLKMQEGYDVVYGVRRKRKESFSKKLAYRLYYLILDNFAEIKIPLDSGDFSMIRRQVLDEMLKMPEQSLFLRGLRSWVGYRQFGYEYERDARFGGEPKYTLGKLFKLAYDGLFSFSQFPVKLLTTLGVVIIIIAILYSIYALIGKFFFPDTPQGFTTLAISIFMFSGIQLLSLGIVGEYIVRIYDESRKRPLYIISKKDF